MQLPAALVSAVMGSKQFMTYTSGAPLQPAGALALGMDDDFFTALVASLRDRRDPLCEGLDAFGFDVLVPQGTYFATTDIRPLGFVDGLEFCRALPERACVVAVPHQVFHDPAHAENPGRPLVRWARRHRRGARAPAGAASAVGRRPLVGRVSDSLCYRVYQTVPRAW